MAAPSITNATTTRWNWPLWAGFLLTLFAFLSYFLIFARWEITRDIPWVNILLFLAAIALLWRGIRNSRSQPQVYRGRIAAPIVGALSLLVIGFFAYVILVMSRAVPPASGAPKVGDKAPDFSAVMADNRPTTLSDMLSQPLTGGRPPKGVVLVFYRGYW